MLKVNVGLSRKLSRDFNSRGFTVNLEGEVNADLSDAEAVVVKVQEFYDTAEECLLRQIERHESDSAIASRDEEVPQASQPAQPPPTPVAATTRPTSPPTRGRTESTPSTNGTVEPATNKQVQFLLNLGKRFGLTTPQLENRIAEILGQRTGVYDLTKRDAGVVLDSLTADSKTSTARR